MRALFGRRTPPEAALSAVGEVLGVLLIDARAGHRVITYANPMAHFLTGHQVLVGKPQSVLVPERSRRVHETHMDRYMLAPTVRPMGADREVWMLLADGSEMRVWIGLAPVGGRGVVAATFIRADVIGPLNPPEQGPPGEQGAPGVQGEKGERGDKGSAGDKGLPSA